ncbi:Zinc transporter ZIP2 [Aphelenchoides besseyi]|nr:Zinc transporter ZIP2 [Aphelenchoides besseyi]KAI6201932.1 Zinc transporter ZIP2 [Aphelenchoides besseyi]
MLLQGVLIIVILLSSIIASLAPIKIYDLITEEARTSLVDKSKNPNRLVLFISCLSCFAGGTFLSVIFLHLLPDAHIFLNDVQQSGSWRTSYPIVELIALLGFFVVYLVEILSDSCFVHAARDQSLVTKNPGILERGRRSASAIHREGHGQNTEFVELQDQEHRNVLIARTISFICALVLHSAVEGFSFGVQTNPTSVVALFLGIVVHRTVVAFSVGTRLINCHAENKPLVVFLALIFSISSPAFAVIGLLLRSSALNSELKSQLSTTLISFSVGTILYITFFEMLVPERGNEKGQHYKFLSMIFGCFIIAMVSFVQ